ncbi:hypothetical protein BV898_03193 [Hypsibius exemplaris]|uniref:G-protein coupled receptors family 1 profile domain-containing protein n=1 Tax=Hypsibius exemplaris TaxID=2072580 RepID=A0A1W0X5E9_HYPEX|nr:hypothetical protein BV898_03193 [Hypsibius exemplaris]
MNNITSFPLPFHANNSSPSPNTHERDGLTLWFAVMLSISSIGILCNALLITVIARSQKLRSGTGFLILNLSFTCIAMCTLNYPVHVILVYGHHFWFTPHPNACTLAHYFTVMTTYANNWSEACLGVNRFVATILPHQYRTFTMWQACLSMGIFTWLIGALSLIPFCTREVGYFTTSSQGQCGLLATTKLGTWLVSFNSYAPYVVVGTAVLSILSKMARRKVRSVGVEPVVTCEKRSRTTDNARQQKLMYRRQINIAGMLLLCFIFNIATTLPMSLLNTFYYELYNRIPLLRLWMRIFVLIQYSFTPMIFFGCNKDYRQGLRNLTGHRAARNNGAPTNTQGLDRMSLHKDAFVSTSASKKLKGSF